jgi:hypothetical protein
MSATHNRSGRSAVKARLTRSWRVSGAVPGTVVRGPFAREIPRRPRVFHQPRGGAASHPLAAGQDLLPVQLCVHLPDPDPVDPVVLLVDPGDHRFEFLIAYRPRRRRAGPGGVEGARSDRHIRVGQRGADRLDSEDVPIPLDVVDDHREGRSSSAAKKAEAVRRIEFARRNSRFSRSSSVSLAESPVVVPGRAPASTQPGSPNYVASQR